MTRHSSTLARRAPAAKDLPPERPVVPLPKSPWPATGLRRLAPLVIVGAVVLAVSWYGCSGETTWRVQVRWFGLGVLACAVNALGCLVWLGAGVRSLRRERAWTTAELRRRDLRPVRPAADAAVAATRSEALVTGARMRRYHRSDCPLMAGKEAQVLSAEAAAARGLPACGVCAP